jgi:predicted RNase H-like nuclease (RuvC/YqgF family)
MWPWTFSIEALQAVVTQQDQRIKELEARVTEHDSQFEELRIRLSGQQQKEETKAAPDTDWLERRRKLTEQYATTKGDVL